MPAKIRCPGCGRRLTRPSEPIAIVCDGCESSFHPGHLVHQSAPIWKRIVGSLLLAIGGLGLILALMRATFLVAVGGGEVLGLIVCPLIIPFLAVCFGLSLLKGKNIVVEPKSAPDDFKG